MLSIIHAEVRYERDQGLYLHSGGVLPLGRIGAAGQSVLHRGADPRCVPIALAFATFENVCYLIQNGADRFSFIFFRGFGTGAMHVLCGLIVGGRKMVRFPLIAEEITEYSLLESCFLAALKFF